MIAITEANYESDYRIKLKFNTGEEGVVDLSDLIERYAIAHPLKSISEFKQFYLDEWPTLAWSCGFDISPETLYERATGNCVAWLQTEPAQQTPEVQAQLESFIATRITEEGNAHNL